MRKERQFEDDDGRTIVDMSEVDPMPVLLIGCVFIVAGAIVIFLMTKIWS